MPHDTSCPLVTAAVLLRVVNVQKEKNRNQKGTSPNTVTEHEKRQKQIEVKPVPKLKEATSPCIVTEHKHGLFDLKGLTCRIVEAKRIPATMPTIERKPNANLSTRGRNQDLVHKVYESWKQSKHQ